VVESWQWGTLLDSPELSTFQWIKEEEKQVFLVDVEVNLSSLCIIAFVLQLGGILMMGYLIM
jgi:hypothetical protein